MYDGRWRITFAGLKGPARLPLVDVVFTPSTVGFQRYLNVTRVQSAREAVIPLPGHSLSIPVSRSRTLCNGFTYDGQLYDRDFSAALTVTVAGHAAQCPFAADAQSMPCLRTYNKSSYPVILSIIPNQGIVATGLSDTCPK